MIQEVIGADVSQWKHIVDSQEQSAIDGYQPQTLPTQLPARQDLWVRLPQPINVRLITKKWAFREMEG